MFLRNLCLIAFTCALPLCATEITDLQFSELLRTPIGDRGPALSDKAISLDGKRVRITGHMARHEIAAPGTFLLAPIPVQLHDEHYGLADDLPATAIFVSGGPNKPIQYTPGLLTVTGVFHIGNHEESDGRISTFRIDLDTSSAPKQSKGGFFKFSKRSKNH
jgi:hypothetical protein